MKSNALTTELLSVEELYETEEYVLVRFRELIDNKITVSLEFGIKDNDGDIVRFIKI